MSKSNWFITGDQHYGHYNPKSGKGIILYCNRPYDNIEEHDEDIMARHNEVVRTNDIVIHNGDFCWATKREEAYKRYVNRLNGNHIFVRGSHDCWLPDSIRRIWQKTINGHFYVVCHNAMRTWERSHYNSRQLHAHSHNRIKPRGKQLDIGVDGHNFYPWALEEIEEYMENRPDNFDSQLNLRERIRAAWHILRKGTPWWEFGEDR